MLNVTADTGTALFSLDAGISGVNTTEYPKLKMDLPCAPTSCKVGRFSDMKDEWRSKIVA